MARLFHCLAYKKPALVAAKQPDTTAHSLLHFTNSLCPILFHINYRIPGLLFVCCIANATSKPS
jgi:hypothetical protein